MRAGGALCYSLWRMEAARSKYFWRIDDHYDFSRSADFLRLLFSVVIWLDVDLRWRKTCRCIVINPASARAVSPQRGNSSSLSDDEKDAVLQRRLREGGGLHLHLGERSGKNACGWTPLHRSCCLWMKTERLCAAGAVFVPVRLGGTRLRLRDVGVSLRSSSSD